MDVSTATRVHSEEFCDYFADSVLVGRTSAVEAGNTVVDAWTFVLRVTSLASESGGR